MAKTNFNSVDEYITTHPENVQLILQLVRRTIRKALPDAASIAKLRAKETAERVKAKHRG